MIPEKYARKKGQSFEDWLMNNLWLAYLDARKAKRSTNDEAEFEANAVENLRRLRDDILERVYKPSHGIAFVSHDPVVREIFAAPFRDRVVHHVLFNCVADWWDKRLIYDSYSCRKGKGVLKGVERLRKKENEAIREFGEEVYIIKMDIKGYFMSLPRKELYERILWGLKRQFKIKNGVYPREYYLLKYLWKEVIFDDPTKGVKIRATESERRLVPRSKTLFAQPPGQGIVIGNLSSQLLSNIYLDALDRYVTFFLGYKYYGRYVDDFYILTPKSKLDTTIKDIKAIKVFLEGLHLKLHPDKIYIQNINRGVLFLGARIYPNRVLPGPRLIKNYKKSALDFVSGNGSVESVISYMGHMTHMKSKRIQQKIFDEVGWDWKF